MVHNGFLDVVAIIVAIGYLLLAAAGVCFIGGLITYGITSIWQEVLIDDVFEVEVIDKAMVEDDGVSCTVLVKGTDFDGQEYCETLTVNPSVYSNIVPGDMLSIRQRTTTQPIFGKGISYTLIEPTLANN